MKPQTPEVTARRIASAPEHYRFAAGGDEARFAVVRGARRVEEVAAYLPDNYGVMESFEEENGPRKPRLVVIVGGIDRFGWTLDSYVIPRLASGMIAAQEIPA
jgi:hypothetical protein